MPRPKLIHTLHKRWDPFNKIWSEETEIDIVPESELFPLFARPGTDEVSISGVEKRFDQEKGRVVHYLWIETWRVPDPLPIAGTM